MQNELAYKGMFDPLKGNRLSVNIAPGGFPHTEVQYDGGLESGMLNKNGAQITAGYPSYILQAVGAPYPFVGAPNCTLEDISK
ncbi:MAG: hypothetical protein Q9200_005656 [Gallowayella weberi]